MAAVKPMIQQPGGAKPNSSYNNNNGRTAAPSMQQEQSIKQVGDRKTLFLFIFFICGSRRVSIKFHPQLFIS